MKNQNLQEYLQTQTIQSHKKLRGIIHDIHSQLLPKRSEFATLQKYATDFLQHGSEPRIIVMPGLRGTGKTTLLAQLFLSLPNENITKLYLSVDEAIQRFDVNLWDIIENYEELTNKHIEEFDAPLFLFFDEIHYDKKWAMFLKSIYDRSKNVMIFCTGSAALLLREQINADVARRVFFVDIHPISFSEYMLLKHKKSCTHEITPALRKALLFSENAAQVFSTLQQSEKLVNHYWLEIDKFVVTRYLKYGTLPFTLNLENEVLAVNFIAQIINKIIYTDIPQLYSFEITTLNRIDKLLYLIADTLGVSVTTLSTTLEMKSDTLRLILKSLETSGVLSRIPPYGAHFKQVKKASKYLFATPALRFVYLSSKESTGTFDNYQGSLLEDLIGMYLQRILPQCGGISLTYDVAEGGADFIISIENQKIVMEIGTGKKSYQQIINTATKITPKYSVIISHDELEYSEKHNAIKIPLKYFLLM